MLAAGGCPKYMNSCACQRGRSARLLRTNAYRQLSTTACHRVAPPSRSRPVFSVLAMWWSTLPATDVTVMACVQRASNVVVNMKHPPLCAVMPKSLYQKTALPALKFLRVPRPISRTRASRHAGRKVSSTHMVLDMRHTVEAHDVQNQSMQAVGIRDCPRRLGVAEDIPHRKPQRERQRIGCRLREQPSALANSRRRRERTPGHLRS